MANLQGTGKTSTVLALARRIYGTSFRKHILELNASDDRGIDVVREQIKNFAMTKVLFSCVASTILGLILIMNSKGFKLIILDEADMMTQAAQSALRRGNWPFYGYIANNQ
jgi:replication factor C subunit 3/5